MRRATTLLLLLLSAPLVWAQFSMEGYLSNSISDAELQFFKARQDFVNDNGFKSPILREVEFRARVRNFGQGFEDYRLRFSPLNPFEKSANNNYRDEIKQQLSISYLMNLEEVLLGRYQIMIEHWQLMEELRIIQTNIDFYSRLLTLYKDQSSLSSIKDYIALDKALLNAQLAFERTNNELAILAYSIKQTYSFEGNILWNSDDFVDMLTIKNWLVDQNSLDLNNNLYLKNEQQKVIVTDAEYNIKKQESFSNIGYVQAEYREDEKNTFGQNMGLQIGVNLPITNPDKPDLARRKLDMLQDSQDFEQERANLQSYFSKASQRLQSQLTQYEMVTAKKRNYMNNNFSIANINNALDVMIELQEFRSDLAKKQVGLAGAIYKDYLNLLSINGRLSQPPYTNYLSRGGTPFDLAPGN